MIPGARCSNPCIIFLEEASFLQRLWGRSLNWCSKGLWSFDGDGRMSRGRNKKNCPFIAFGSFLFYKSIDLNSTFTECHSFFLGSHPNRPFGWVKVKMHFWPVNVLEIMARLREIILYINNFYRELYRKQGAKICFRSQEQN